MALSRKKIGGEAPMVVSQVTDTCLYAGFFGTLDSARMKAVTEKILNLLQASGIEIIVLDMANVDLIDSAVANHLIKIGDTMKLSGVEVVFAGISPIVAQTMSSAGVDFTKFRVSRDFRSALKEVFLLQGLELIPINGNTEQQQQQDRM